MNRITKIWMIVSLFTVMLSLGLEAAPVNIPDANLKAAIEAELGVTDPEPADMLNLTSLETDNESISDLTGLETATNLSELWLHDNDINDLSPLAGLTNLTFLDLHSNNISDISPLMGLTNLTYVRLQYNEISNLSPLSGLTNLTDIRLHYNQISDLSPLAGLTNLTGLTLSGNQINDTIYLAGLTNLTYLKLSTNQISDLSPLVGMTNLTSLYLYSNQISDIAALAGLTNLTYLNLHHNQISDLSPLAGMTVLARLFLDNNQISDISLLAGLTNLEKLYLYNNQISDISPLVGMTNLTYLDLRSNPLGPDAYDNLLLIMADNPGIDLYSNLDVINITITKMTVKAGKSRDAVGDSFSVTGTFDATADDFTTADTVYVNVGLYEETIDCADFKQAGKKPKFTYKGTGSITSLTLDMKKGTFKIIAKKVDLTGMSDPVEVWLIFGEFVGIGETTEDVINAKKYLPMQLQSGYADNLRVEKVVCKPGKENNVKNLVVSGSLATEDDIDLRTASLLLQWGTAEHPVGLGEFELKGKTKYQYKKKPDDLDPAHIVIMIDPTKCTFQIVAKNTNWTWQNSPVNFGLEFGSFDETEEVSFE